MITKRVLSVLARVFNRTDAVITFADGSTYNLGRVDGPFPVRAWFYRYVVYPRKLREQQQGGKA